MNIITIIAVILAYIIKGMCGFANTLIFGTIMSFTTNNINISPIELIVGYPSNIFIMWKERKGISAKLSDQLVRKIVVILLILSGVALIINNIGLGAF